VWPRHRSPRCFSSLTALRTRPCVNARNPWTYASERVVRIAKCARALLLAVLLAPAVDMLFGVSRLGVSLVGATTIPQPSSEPWGRPERAHQRRSRGSRLEIDRLPTRILVAQQGSDGSVPPRSVRARLGGGRRGVRVGPLRAEQDRAAPTGGKTIAAVLLRGFRWCSCAPTATPRRRAKPRRAGARPG
jgi:hypothetical protein